MYYTILYKVLHFNPSEDFATSTQVILLKTFTSINRGERSSHSLGSLSTFFPMEGFFSTFIVRSMLGVYAYFLNDAVRVFVEVEVHVHRTL